MATFDFGSSEHVARDDIGKNSIAEYAAEIHDHKEMLSDPNNAKQSLHRGLSARQISMIAIGGAIGISDSRCD